MACGGLKTGFERSLRKYGKADNQVGMSEKEAWVALNLIPGLGPVKVRRLLERFGSARQILSAGEEDLRGVAGVGGDLARTIRDWRRHVDVEGEIKLAGELGARIISMADGEYPEILKQIHDPPVVLYLWGGFEGRDRHAVGVVGTRNPSVYGSEMANKLAYQLAYAGVTVVSGLARGVDTAAHLGALAAGGRTIAVVGSGLAQLYPPENAELAERIRGSGVVVSEFPLRTSADRQTFPMRNRIVSGLSVGLLVVEAGVRSGALITAGMAAEQGRSVFALPGRVDSPRSAGCNRLIQQGAKLVTCAQDVLDEFGLLFREVPELRGREMPEGLSEVERKVFEAVGDGEPTVDEVVGRSGLPTNEVASTLLSLELRKLIRSLPGGRMVRTG